MSFTSVYEVGKKFILIIAGIAIGGAGAIQLRGPREMLSEDQHQLLSAAQEAGIREGVVLVVVSWGNRIVNRLRSLRVAEDLIDELYAQADHCELQLILDAIDQGNLNSEQIHSALRQLKKEAQGKPPLPQRLTDDRSLQLTPQRQLHPSCAREIAFDREGYSDFLPYGRPTKFLQSPWMAKKGVLHGPLIFAADMNTTNEKLLARFPNALVYRLRRKTFETIERPLYDSPNQ